MISEDMSTKVIACRGCGETAMVDGRGAATDYYCSDSCRRVVSSGCSTPRSVSGDLRHMSLARWRRKIGATGSLKGRA